MKKLMNLMNLMKQKMGVEGVLKKIRVFFSQERSKTAIYGSQTFICFIKSAYLLIMRSFSAAFASQLHKLMNLMNICVVGLLKRFSKNAQFVRSEKMNLFDVVTSHKFINPLRDLVLSPTANQIVHWSGDVLLDDQAAEDERRAREAFLEARLEWERSLAGQRSMRWTELAAFGLAIVLAGLVVAFVLLVIWLAFGGV